MIDVDSTILWAAVVILAVPILIIVAAEIDERLRQRDSVLRPAVAVIRGWGLPFFALWAVFVPVLSMDSERVVVRLAASGVVLALAIAVLRIVQALVTAYQRRPRLAGTRSVPQLLLALPRLATIIVAGWLLIDTVWGVDLSAALTALGVTSLVISFALQDTLSGLASGMLLLSDQPFKPGDWISTEGTEGEVIDVSWRTSRIRDRNGDIIVVPNSQLAGAAVVNYSAPDPLHRVVVSLQVAFKNPPTLAIDMLLDAARSVDGVVEDPPPRVLVTQIDDPLMGYDVHLWVRDYEIVPRVKSDFGRLVWYQSHRHNVPLPSPAQDLYLWDGPATEVAGVPTTEDLRNVLQGAPLFATLTDTELDAMAAASHQVRFAAGETLRGPGSRTRDLLVIAEGTAELVVPVDDGHLSVAEFQAGETVGVLDLRSPSSRGARLRAVSDCEIVSVDVDTAGTIASRNEEMSRALNRLAAIRRRRLERAVERADQNRSLELSTTLVEALRGVTVEEATTPDGAPTPAAGSVPIGPITPAGPHEPRADDGPDVDDPADGDEGVRR